MILFNCTKADIDKALSIVNEKFSGNVRLNNYQAIRLDPGSHRVTLRVLDSHGSGAHLSMHMYTGRSRRTISACWHVHGTFFDALPYGTRIRSNGKVTMAGDMWNDFNVGSTMYPCYASDSCECNK